MPSHSPADTAPTPAWWRRRSTRTQLVLLATLLPGVLLHELTHGLVARPWADVEYRWDLVAVDLHWRPGTPRWAVAAAHLAPLAVGWVAGFAALLAALAGHTVTLLLAHVPVVVYVLLNWAFYTWLVLWDLDF